jgi:hypothetical protein
MADKRLPARLRAAHQTGDVRDFWKINMPDAPPARGTRASANTSGPDFIRALRPNEIAEQGDPHRTKKACFFCRTGFQKERTL